HSACLLQRMLMKEVRVPGAVAAALAAAAFGGTPASAQSAAANRAARAEAPAAASTVAATPTATRYEDIARQRSLVLQLFGRQALVQLEDTAHVLVPP